MPGTNENLGNAKKAKNDEFYTYYEDIEKEVSNYKDYLRDKTIFLPCDDENSQFFKFFSDHFTEYGLKRIIATCKKEIGPGSMVGTNGNATVIGELKGDGDFRSEEVNEILEECDIVITNPPFSMFRAFVSWIMKYNKQFLIIGSQNAYTYKDFFPLIKDNKVWVGHNMVKKFKQPDGSIKEFGNICWFTNIPNSKRNALLPLTKSYNPTDYPTYDNYNAIEVGKCKNIPCDYEGVMGVPITFINIYNPSQFEIIGHTSSSDKSPEVEELRTDPDHRNRGRINGQEKYDRVLIRKL